MQIHCAWERNEAKSDFSLWIDETTPLCPLCGHLKYYRSRWLAATTYIFHVELWGIYSKSDFNIWSQDQQQLMYFSTIILISMRWAKVPTEVHPDDKKEDEWISNWDLKIKMQKSYQHCVLSGDDRRERNKVWFCDTRVNLQSDLFPKPSLKCYALLPAPPLFWWSFQPSWRANPSWLPLTCHWKCLRQEGGG